MVKVCVLATDRHVADGRVALPTIATRVPEPETVIVTDSGRTDSDRRGVPRVPFISRLGPQHGMARTACRDNHLQRSHLQAKHMVLEGDCGDVFHKAIAVWALAIVLELEYVSLNARTTDLYMIVVGTRTQWAGGGAGLCAWSATRRPCKRESTIRSRPLGRARRATEVVMGVVLFGLPSIRSVGTSEIVSTLRLALCNGIEGHAPQKVGRVVLTRHFQ